MYSVFINKLRMASIHILPKQPPNPQGPNRNSSKEHLNEKIKLVDCFIFSLNNNCIHSYVRISKEKNSALVCIFKKQPSE